MLAEFFARSYKLFQRFVRRDLAPGYLARLSTMENPVSPKVPLPPSNTDDSKRMRIATGLLAYGKQLAISIWRPTYVTEDEGMNNVLDELNARDSQHEAQLRATILKALGVLEEHHEKVKRARVAKVEKRVFEALKFLVPDDKHVEFRNELQKLTSKISEIWEKLQSLETIVEPHFDVLGSGEWYALPEPDLLAGGELGKQKAPEKDEDVVIQVWPVFLYEDDETVLLHRAYTLTPQQVAGAEAEKAKNERARRAARQAERQNGVVRKRRDSGVGFLENGGSPGGTPPV